MIFFIPLYKHHRLPRSEYSLVMIVLPKQRKRPVPENETLMEVVFIFSVVKYVLRNAVLIILYVRDFNKPQF